MNDIKLMHEQEWREKLAKIKNIILMKPEQYKIGKKKKKIKRFLQIFWNEVEIKETKQRHFYKSEVIIQYGFHSKN